MVPKQFVGLTIIIQFPGKYGGSGNNKLLFDQNLGFSKETGSRILNKKPNIVSRRRYLKNILKYTQKFI